MNTRAVADAIAARFAGVTVGTDAIRTGPTARLPDGVSVDPALIVFPPAGVLDVGVSKLRRDELDFPIRLLLRGADLPRRSDALYAWYDAIRDQVEKDIDLGLAYVAWARPISMTVELDGFLYAGTAFDLIELIVRVHFNEVVTTVSS